MFEINLFASTIIMALGAEIRVVTGGEILMEKLKTLSHEAH